MSIRFSHTVLNLDLIREFGVATAVFWQFLQDEAQRAHFNGDAIRHMGQIKFAPMFDKPSTIALFDRIGDLEDKEKWALNLQEIGWIKADGAYVIMADPFGIDAPKVAIKDEYAGLRWLYVFRDGGGLIKIGITKDIKRRAKELFPAVEVCSRKIKNANKLETQLLEKYKMWCVGGEWFNLPEDKADEVISFVEGL